MAGNVLLAKGRITKDMIAMAPTGMNTGHEENYYQVKDQRFLGEDEFVDKVEGLKKNMGLGTGEFP